MTGKGKDDLPPLAPPYKGGELKDTGSSIRSGMTEMGKGALPPLAPPYKGGE